MDFPLPVPPMMAVASPRRQTKFRWLRVSSSASAKRKETSRKASTSSPAVVRVLGILGDHVLDLRRVFQHSLHPLAALQGPGHGQDDHLGHHQEEEHHHGIGDDGGNVADLKVARC